MARMSKAERESYLAEAHVAILALPDETRGPLAVPVWYFYEPGGEVVFMTLQDSHKGRLLELDRRISLCVQRDRSPYKYVSVEGPIVALEEATLEAHLRPLATRYLGEADGNAYADRVAPQLASAARVLVRMRPERWLTADYGKG